MADFEIKYTARPTTEELISRFNLAERVVRDSQRRRMTALGGRLLRMVRDEAPKKTGKFASGIRLDMSHHGDRSTIEVAVPSPLGRWITQGTRPHTIRPKGNYPLRFFWARGPQGPRVYSFWSVNHPGTKANPFIARAYRRWLPEAQREIRELGNDYARAVRSGPGAGQFGY